MKPVFTNDFCVTNELVFAHDVCVTSELVFPDDFLRQNSISEMI